MGHYFEKKNSYENFTFSISHSIFSISIFPFQIFFNVSFHHHAQKNITVEKAQESRGNLKVKMEGHASSSVATWSLL